MPNAALQQCRHVSGDPIRRGSRMAHPPLWSSEYYNWPVIKVLLREMVSRKRTQRFMHTLGDAIERMNTHDT